MQSSFRNKILSALRIAENYVKGAQFPSALIYYVPLAPRPSFTFDQDKFDKQTMLDAAKYKVTRPDREKLANILTEMHVKGPFDGVKVYDTSAFAKDISDSKLHMAAGTLLRVNLYMYLALHDPAINIIMSLPATLAYLTIHPWGRNVNGDDEYVVTYTNRVKEILASYKCNTDHIKKLRYGSLENLENIKEDNSDPNDIYNSLYPANTYSDGKQ